MSRSGGRSLFDSHLESHHELPSGRNPAVGGQLFGCCELPDNPLR